MVARMPPAGARPAVPELAQRLAVAAGAVAFVLVGGVALTAGVGVEAAAMRSLVGAVVWGGLAGVCGYALSPRDAPAPQPPLARGRMLDVTLPQEGDE